jgi:hypothetical protein
MGIFGGVDSPRQQPRRDPSEWMPQLANEFERLVELSAGHKARAISAGLSEDAANAMAVQMHSVLCKAIETKLTTE